MIANSQQEDDRRLRQEEDKKKGRLLLTFALLQIKIIHIYLSMSRAIDRVFHNPVENSSRGHPCTPVSYTHLTLPTSDLV